MVRIDIKPRVASGLAPPSNELRKPTTRPALLDVQVQSKQQRAARNAELPALLRRQAE